MANNEYNILMFGPTAVGKTSLLTSMYKGLNGLIDFGGLNINADETSSKQFQETYIQMINIFKQEELLVKTGIAAGQDEREFKFELLDHSNKEPFMKINFIDIPGEWVGLNAKDYQIKKVKEHIIKSDILLITIDSPAMMEHGGDHMPKINNPDIINDALVRIIKADKNRLIIFCPVKCEKYLDTEVKSNNSFALTKETKKYYGKSLDYFRKNLSNNICVAITPVQTLGGVRLQKVIVENGEPLFSFVKKTADSKLSPKDCDQPLRYILSFILSQHISNEGFWSWLFGSNRFVRNALIKFSRGIKKETPFEIIQGENLLDVK